MLVSSSIRQLVNHQLKTQINFKPLKCINFNDFLRCFSKLYVLYYYKCSYCLCCYVVYVLRKWLKITFHLGIVFSSTNENSVCVIYVMA